MLLMGTDVQYTDWILKINRSLPTQVHKKTLKTSILSVYEIDSADRLKLLLARQLLLHLGSIIRV
jgi:hypothetical protein